MKKNTKNLSDLQIELDDYINQFKVGYFSPLSQMIQLTEEVGELAKEINHQYGDKVKKTSEMKSSIEEEIGDVLISTIIMANALNINLDDVMVKNMDKFRKRDFNRFERKDEDKK